MENRYLFRAKRIDNGEWVEGYYVKGLDMHDKEVHMIFEPGTIFYSSGETDGWVEVEASTICRCTGREDKNGKLIFENDILSGHIDVEFPEDETRKRVVWHENGWCANEPGCDDYEELDDFDSENFEVIGNMIDNPELLEV
jgi:uncharacterized phage protein (TIGR01671 family)